MKTLQRVNYFTSRLLSAADFQAEQSYHREKQRRHNRLIHGTGVLHGLQVSVRSVGRRRIVHVEPGVAIDPHGNELCLPEAESAPMPSHARACRIVLRFIETPIDLSPISDADSAAPHHFARVEESCEVAALSEEEPVPDVTDLTLARFRKVGGVWRRDRRFRPRQLA